MQSRCDIVLIDAPPTLLLGDALLLSRLAEAVFVCVQVPRVTRSMLDGLHRALTNARARTLGFVMTGDLGTGAGYGYGYAYDYGFEPEPAPPVDEASAAREPAARQ